MSTYTSEKLAAAAAVSIKTRGVNETLWRAGNVTPNRTGEVTNYRYGDGSTVSKATRFQSTGVTAGVSTITTGHSIPVKKIDDDLLVTYHPVQFTAKWVGDEEVLTGAVMIERLIAELEMLVPAWTAGDPDLTIVNLLASGVSNAL